MSRLDELNEQIQELESERAVLHAATARREIYQLCPRAAMVVFEGPQEPSGSAMIIKLLTADGQVIYDQKQNINPETFDNGDDLAWSEYFLAAALEDDSKVFAPGEPGYYVMPIHE